MYSVYVLRTSDNSFYIGQTSNIESRLARHRRGECLYTKSRLPVTVVYEENFKSRAEAMKREKYLKSLKSHKAIQALINT